jgi:hypothetical protein
LERSEGLERLIGDVENTVPQLLKALICHIPGSTGELQNNRKREAQRAVDEKNVADMEGYKQV